MTDKLDNEDSLSIPADIKEEIRNLRKAKALLIMMNEKAGQDLKKYRPDLFTSNQ